MPKTTASHTAFSHLTPLQRQRLVQKIDHALPQTQCQRCDYEDCYHYAQAIIESGEKINRCPPGGSYGIEKLAQLTGQRVCALAADVGPPAVHSLAVIDEDWCIGCTKCLKVCPVDAILGAKKKAHTVLSQDCTGCELCVPVCPVDCIAIVPVEDKHSGPSSQSLWSEEQSRHFKVRYGVHQERMEKMRQAKMLSALATQKIQAETLTTAPTPEHKKELLKHIVRKARTKLGSE